MSIGTPTTSTYLRRMLRKTTSFTLPSNIYIYIYIYKIIKNKLSVFFRIFEKVRQYFGQQGESIPMSFVLGFYVSLIVKRWWEQYRLLPWPDSLALFVSAAIPGVVSTCELGG